MNRRLGSLLRGRGGSLAMLGGLGVFGVAGFVFLGLAGRDLGPALSASVSTAWTAINALGIGLFMPVEQEVSRLTAARRGTGAPAPLLRHVGRYLVGVGIATLAASAIVGRWIADTFFAGDLTITWLTALALVAMGAEYFVRGTLSGSGHFVSYGSQLAIDGGVRIVLAVAVFLSPWGSPGAYAVALVVAPLVATLATLPAAPIAWLRDRPTAQTATPLAPLVLTSVSSQLLANAGPLAIMAMARRDEDAVAGNFVAAVTVARIPLFAFAALQAIFLPALARLAAANDPDGFRASLRRLLAATALLAVAGLLGIVLLGQWILHLIYGAAFQIASLDLNLIALSGALFMAAQALAQGLLALRRDALVLAGWSVGLAATLLTLVAPLPLATRVASALTAGSAIAAILLAGALAVAMRRWHATMDRSAPPPTGGTP